MSFSASVKTELCRDEIRRGCCALAELHGVLLYANTFSADCIRIVTENRDFGERLVRLLRKALSLRFDVLPDVQTGGKLIYLLTDPEKIHQVFEQCGFSAQTSVSLHVNLALLENDCCKRAFLRGAFLAGGSVTDPEKRYHLELSTTHLKVIRETDTLMQEMGLAPKQTERKGSGVLYYKQSDSIEDFLTCIGAPVSAMAVMQAKSKRTGATRPTERRTATRPMSPRRWTPRSSSLPPCAGWKNAGYWTRFPKNCGKRRFCVRRIRRRRSASWRSCMTHPRQSPRSTTG